MLQGKILIQISFGLAGTEKILLQKNAVDPRGPDWKVVELQQ